MPGEVQKFDDFQFHGDVLPLRVRDRRQHVSGLRICDVFRLDPVEQYRAIRLDEELCEYLYLEHTPRGTLWYIAAEAIPLWFALIVKRESLPFELQEKHRSYRGSIIRAVIEYTTKGIAINETLVGPEAKAEIEARFAEKKAAYLRALQDGANYVRRHLAHDALAVAYADAAVKGYLAQSVGTGTAASDLPAGVRVIAELGGVIIPAKLVPAFGTLVKERYAAKYRSQPETTISIMKSRPEIKFPIEVSPTGHQIANYKVYWPKDWPWIQEEARRFMSPRGCS